MPSASNRSAVSHANESCASSSAATDDTVMRLAVAERAEPAAGPPAHAERGRRHDADDELARVLEPDERRPDRDAAHVALRAVDRVDDPAVLGVAVAGGRSPNSSPSTAWPVVRREPLADRPLDRLVGLAHRREVGLGRDLQIVRPGTAPS